MNDYKTITKLLKMIKMKLVLDYLKNPILLN